MGKNKDKQDSPSSLKAKAEDAASTSWLKWVADHFLAASQYEQAAKAYFAEQNYSEARDCWEKSAYHRDQDGDGYGAARGYEEAAKLSMDKLKDFDGGLKGMDLALSCYVQRGKEEASCRLALKKIELLEKAAKKPKVIQEAFEKCVEVHTTFEKWYPLNEIFMKYENFMTLQIGSLLNKSRSHGNELVDNVTKVYEVLDRHIENQKRLKNGAGVQLLAKVCLCLATTQDLVRVKMFLEESNQWNESMHAGPPMLDLAYSMYDAYESRDAERLEGLVNRQTLTMMPLEICKLAKARIAVVGAPVTKNTTKAGGGKSAKSTKKSPREVLHRIDTGLDDFVDHQGNLRQNEDNIEDDDDGPDLS